MSIVINVSCLFFWLPLSQFIGSQDSSVGIVSDYGLDDRWVEVRVPVRSRIFSFPRRPDRLWGPIQLVTGDLSPGVKRPGLEADHSPPASAEVKKM
jgi:hypothetical protein